MCFHSQKCFNIKLFPRKHIAKCVWVTRMMHIFTGRVKDPCTKWFRRTCEKVLIQGWAYGVLVFIKGNRTQNQTYIIIGGYRPTTSEGFPVESTLHKRAGRFILHLVVASFLRISSPFLHSAMLSARSRSMSRVLSKNSRHIHATPTWNAEPKGEGLNRYSRTVTAPKSQGASQVRGWYCVVF